MIFVHEVQQEMFLDTPRGKAKVFALIYRGSEANLKWLCFMQETGEIWEMDNSEARAEKNITIGRRENERRAAPLSAVCLSCYGKGSLPDASGGIAIVCPDCGGNGRRT